jgi:hypothetical protein
MDRDRVVRTNLIFVVVALALLAGGLVLVSKFELSQAVRTHPNLVTIVGGGLVLYGAGFVLLLYLRGGLRRSGTLQESTTAGLMHVAAELEHRDAALEKTLAGLQTRVEAIEKAAVGLPAGEKDAFLAALRSDVQATLVSDLAEDLEKRYADSIVNEAQVKQIRAGMEGTSNRLRFEIDQLSRRGNLNLVFGTLTTAVAVGLLAYMVFTAHIQPLDMASVLAHFIPRISTAAFIEVFSFFFLRLYKSSLSDIKYYQNELTSLELKAVAVETALLRSQSEIIPSIAEHLARTDRNLAVPSEKQAAADVPLLKEVAELLARLDKILPKTSRE